MITQWPFENGYLLGLDGLLGCSTDAAANAYSGLDLYVPDTWADELRCLFIRWNVHVCDAEHGAAERLPVVIEAPREEVKRQMQEALGGVVDQACSSAALGQAPGQLHCDLHLHLGDTRTCFGCHRYRPLTRNVQLEPERGFLSVITFWVVSL